MDPGTPPEAEIRCGALAPDPGAPQGRTWSLAASRNRAGARALGCGWSRAGAGGIRPSVVMRIGQLRPAHRPGTPLEAATRAAPAGVHRTSTGGRHVHSNRARRGRLHRGAVTAMAVELTHREGGYVVTVHDPAELPLLGWMADRVGDVDGSVVVDVSSLTIAPHAGADALVDAVRAIAAAATGQRWSFVATRLSARKVLRRLCAGSTVHVYPSVGIALAATVPGVGR